MSFLATKEVTILIKHNLNIKVTNFTEYNNGGFASVFVEIEDVRLDTVNVYAPNNPVEREKFLTKVTAKLHISDVWIQN